MLGVLLVRLLDINRIELCSGKFGLPPLLPCGLLDLFTMMAARALRVVLHILDQANLDYISIDKAVSCQVSSVHIIVNTAEWEVSDDEWRVVATVLMSPLERKA